jgi:hypothetical protein
MSTQLTLGQAARHCGVSKGTISKAIGSGKLSATRREDGSWAIDGAELARYVEVNGHRFRTETVQSRIETDFGEQLATVAELRARAELAEQRLGDLKTMLDDMRRQRDDAERQRDKWETVATRLSLSAPKPDQQPAATPAPPVTTTALVPVTPPAPQAATEPATPAAERRRRRLASLFEGGILDWRWMRATG